MKIILKNGLYGRFLYLFQIYFEFFDRQKILMCVYDYDYRKFERRFFTC